MEENGSPLSDLSFFRFPAVTPEVVQDIILLFILLLLAVLVTVVVHRRIVEGHRIKQHRRSFEHVSRQGGLPAYARELLERLVALSPYRDGPALIRDAWAFERAVQGLLERDPEADVDALARLRQVFHLNVMNPNLEVVSTRQLLRDLPVRLVARRGEDTLDLYCSVLNINETYLLLDLPYEPEVVDFLRGGPECQLIYWREREGETVFPTTLEVVESPEMTFFRVPHAFRSEEASQRAAFRLTMDLPVDYLYIGREKLGKLKAREAHEAAGLQRGEGRMINLSYGGAAFVAPEPLAPHGMAQLRFSIHDQPVHAMLEVLTHARLADGQWRHHGQFRGMTPEIRQRIHRYLSREQMVRLREKEMFRTRPRQ